MGLEPWPYEIGDLCHNCWGEGKTFGDFPTPKKVIATFEGMQPQGGFYDCPPNGPWILTQHPDWPCAFFGTWEVTCVDIPHILDVSYTVRDNTSHLDAVWRFSFVWFEEDNENVLCNTTFNNRDHLIGGTGNVS